MRRTSGKPLNPKIVKDLENFDIQTSLVAMHNFQYKFYEEQQRHFKQNKADHNVIFKEKLRKVDWKFMPKSHVNKKGIRSLGKLQPVRPTTQAEAKMPLRDLVSTDTDVRAKNQRDIKKKVQILNKTIQSIHDTIMDSANLPRTKSSDTKERKDAEESFVLQAIKRKVSNNSLNNTYSNLRQSSYSNMNASEGKPKTETSLLQVPAAHLSIFGQKQANEYFKTTDNNEYGLFDDSKRKTSLGRNLDLASGTPPKPTVVLKQHLTKVYGPATSLNIKSLSHLSQIDEEISRRPALVTDSSNRPGTAQIEQFMVDTPQASSSKRYRMIRK